MQALNDREKQAAEKKQLMDNTYRDSVATINQEGKRVWIFPKKPHGFFYTWRKGLSYFYLILFFGLPFIKIDGEPLFLLNVLERKFILFGFIFWPQDFVLFGIAMLTFIVFIILFTVIFGRLFCGWACPQTIFMEMVFRRIEYWVDGDASEQKRLKNSAWTSEKIRKRTIKHALFLMLSLLISHTFLSYILGLDQVIKLVSEPLINHIGSFIAISIFTLIFYGVYTFFREQVCLIACPYGRLQGVMLDKNSIVVAYDYFRGEKRGKFHKNETRTLGDCIDCKACVHVCPTGIDIRNGTQLECINCTACIDACDHIMESVNLPKGLIRYDSEAGIAKGEKLRFNARIAGYSAVLTILLIGLISGLAMRPEIETNVLRAKGLLFQETDSLHISNLYNYKLINKSKRSIQIQLKVEGLDDAKIQFVGKGIQQVAKGELVEGSFFIIVPKLAMKKHKNDIHLAIEEDGKAIDHIETVFMAPSPKKNKKSSK